MSHVVKVEHVDHNADGTTTLYCRDKDGDPFIKTYPAGASVMRVIPEDEQ